MSAIQTLAYSQFVEILRKALPNVELPDNTVELMLSVMKEGERERLTDFVGSFVMPTIDQVNSSNLKATVKHLPFMPDRVDYMMDQPGRCPAIEYAGGMFCPCCAKCKDGNDFCKDHMEKPSPFGNYAERLEQWDEGKNVGVLSYEVDGKKYKEITYGQYLMKKGLTPETVKKAIKEAHLMIKLAEHDLRVPEKIKKAQGRPSNKKVQAVDDEERDESEEKSEEEPKKATRVNLTAEEKKALKAEADAAAAVAKAQKAEAAAEKKKLVEERKAAEAIVKAQKAVERAKQMEEKAKNVLESGGKPKPKAVNPVKAASPKTAPPNLGTSLDDVYYTGSDPLEEAEADGETIWVDNENNVYNAQKKKIGIIEDGELVRM
jgi:hypothetical protein